MRRGELWTVSGGAAYTGKPRPVLVVQDDIFDGVDSVVVCPLTTNATDAPYFRPAVIPNDKNGISRPSRIMIDKISAIPKSRVGEYIGELDSRDMTRVDRALLVFLGDAGSILRPYDND